MRMWGVPAALLCRKHLVGEHLEMHMFVGAIQRGTSVRGYAAQRILDTRLLKSRHDELATEMRARGYLHHSPLRYNDKLSLGSVDTAHSLAELARRCFECRTRIE